MELALKMILTGSVVTALVLVANRFGEVIGGLLSGLPFTTAPALLLMGHERGLAMAADAAIGGIVGCALASVFALAYHGAARRLAPAPTVGIAIACMAASVWMLSQLSMTLALAGVVTCACSAGALLFIRDPLAGKRSAPLRTSRETWPAVSIGLLSAAMPAAVIEMNAPLAGIVATMPMLGIALAASWHVRRGRAAVPTYLRAYVVSSFAKAVFCAVFAVCVMTHGVAVALLAACLLAGLVCALAIAVKPTARITPTPRRRRTTLKSIRGGGNGGCRPRNSAESRYRSPMKHPTDWLRAARDHWQWRGDKRPPFAVTPAAGQTSVWDFPRPPRLAPDTREVVIRWGGVEVARTRRAVRVLETAHPPSFYLPRADVATRLLVPAGGSSFCEWKGPARYWSLVDGERRLTAVGWSYPEPLAGAEALADCIAFYPTALECRVDGDLVRAQPGGFYGGWITSELTGPFKGEPGSEGW